MTRRPASSSRRPLGVEPCFVATPFDSMIGGELGRPLRRGLGIRRDHCVAHGGSLRHAAVLLDARQLLRPGGLAGHEAGGAVGQDRSVPARAAPTTSISAGRSSSRAPRSTGSSMIPRSSPTTRRSPGLKDTADGKIDAFLCSEPVGLGAIKDGAALRELDTPAYFTQKTGYVDRDLTLDPAAFIDAHQRRDRGPPRERQAQGAVDRVLRLRLRHAGAASSTSRASARPVP